ncbi:unnamed protein product [Protopolystoma xenopodis]|uniref:Uncharacterized protein n=1 Tax=Protopolystoma xenopodis TaxID=117903 RepID=A0A448WUQ0_9PLAT|nr:unnamed protein product [Protopolystoma xenopodis]
MAQAAAAFAHRAAVKASRLADWFEPVGEAPLGQGAPSTTSPHFLPPHVPRIFNLGVGAPVAPGLGPGPVGQHHIRHAAALPGPPMPPQQQAHHLVAGPPAVPLEAAEVLLHDPGLHHQLAPPPVFPGPGAAPVHAQLPVNPIAGPVAALAFFPPVRPAPLQLGMAAGVLPPRRQVGPIQAGVAELPHAQGGGRRRGASPPLPAQPALAIAGGLGQNLAGPLAPVPGQLPQLQVRPQALQQHANIVRNLPAAAAVHMVQNPHHHHHHNQQHEQYLNHHYIQHNQHQGQAQHHNHHSDASRAAVAISGSGLVSPLPSLYHWISLPQSITNLTKLDLVHFTVADPFVNFTAPKLQSFVMNNCVGLQRSMRFMRLFYALARAPQLARLELVAARFIGEFHS